MPDTAASGREAGRVADGVAYWSPARWRLPAPGGGDRVAAMRTLIQRLADLGAAAENRPPRPVPRLPHHTALPDQLRVVADDLARAEPDPGLLAAAQKAIAQARSVLF